MKRLFFLVLMALLLCSLLFTGCKNATDVTAPTPSVETTEQPAALFFYSSDCGTCHRMRVFLDQLVELNPGLSIRQLEIDENPQEWRDACDAAGITAWGVPRLFIGDLVLVDWREQDGELIYRPELEGYLGYRNQVVSALEAACGHTLQLAP